MKVTYCPGCGAELKDKQALGRVYGSGEDSDKLWGFDVYCSACKWSGDIAPDKPEEDD